jgi:hypothetical protein
VQGCAQFEQKLRQCMDQPVCPGSSVDTKHALTLSSATATPRRTTSTTTCRECTPRSLVLTSETKRKLYRGASNSVHYLYTHGTATCARCQRAHRRGLISAIKTLGRRSGEVDTVVYMQYKKRWNLPYYTHFCIQGRKQPT